MNKSIYFDMDGTIADFYQVENWLDKITVYDVSPYKDARPMVNMNMLARVLNKLKKENYFIGIVSWTAKTHSKPFHKKIEKAKRAWLIKHLKSVQFDEIKIIPYGKNKSQAVSKRGGLLFDDESQNRETWDGVAHDEKNILKILKKLLKNA